jgi:hypothetical protein
MIRACIIAAALLMPVTALSAENASVYTSVDISKCQEIEPANPDEGFGGSVQCEGHGGLNVFWTGGDNRDYLAFGKNPQTHCAAKQTFSNFNVAGEKLEWRLHNNVPVATILRWTVTRDVDGTMQKKEWLAVARLEPQNSCVLAIVDGSWPNANDKARKVADEIAGEGFACIGTTLKTFANSGTDVEVGAFGPACEGE